MESSFVIGLSSWIIQDGNYRDFKQGDAKEVCIIGADLSGNFLLRHCDGSVRYWDHQSQADVVLAPSIRDFVARLSGRGTQT